MVVKAPDLLGHSAIRIVVEVADALGRGAIRVVVKIPDFLAGRDLKSKDGARLDMRGNDLRHMHHKISSKTERSEQRPAHTQIAGATRPAEDVAGARSICEQLADLLPHRSAWILPSGRVVDIAKEGLTDDESAFSHGIFVKKWVRFRTDRFCPDADEQIVAQWIRKYAQRLLAERPQLAGEYSSEDECAFYGDAAYKQAALEEKWVRIKAPHHPGDKTIDVEFFREDDVRETIQAIREVADGLGCRLRLMQGGPASRLHL